MFIYVQRTLTVISYTVNMLTVYTCIYKYCMYIYTVDVVYIYIPYSVLCLKYCTRLGVIYVHIYAVHILYLCMYQYMYIYCMVYYTYIHILYIYCMVCIYCYIYCIVYILMVHLHTHTVHLLYGVYTVTYTAWCTYTHTVHVL